LQGKAFDNHINNLFEKKDFTSDKFFENRKLSCFADNSLKNMRIGKINFPFYFSACFFFTNAFIDSNLNIENVNIDIVKMENEKVENGKMEVINVEQQNKKKELTIDKTENERIESDEDSEEENVIENRIIIDFDVLDSDKNKKKKCNLIDYDVKNFGKVFCDDLKKNEKMLFCTGQSIFYFPKGCKAGHEYLPDFAQVFGTSFPVYIPYLGPKIFNLCVKFSVDCNCFGCFANEEIGSLFFIIIFSCFLSKRILCRSIHRIEK
jgi:hypothetical protein